MIYTVKAVLTILITITMQICSINIVESTPAEASEDFLEALKQQETRTLERYMDNDYMNFICNAEGDGNTIKKMNEALFSEFDYDVEKVKQKNGVAVARVVITNNDFSSVMKSYEKVSYDYIMENLYEEKIGDKKALEKKCLEIYVDEIEKSVKNGQPIETVVFIPMVDNGYHDWDVLVTDELMKTVLGNLTMPVEQ